MNEQSPFTKVGLLEGWACLMKVCHWVWAVKNENLTPLLDECFAFCYAKMWAIWRRQLLPCLNCLSYFAVPAMQYSLKPFQQAVSVRHFLIPANINASVRI